MNTSCASWHNCMMSPSFTTFVNEQPADPTFNILQMKSSMSKRVAVVGCCVVGGVVIVASYEEGSSAE